MNGRWRREQMMNRALSHIRSMSITSRLVLYFMLLLLIQTVLIGWVSYTWSSDYLEKGFIEKTQELNGSFVRQVNNIRVNGGEHSDRILANRTVQQILLRNHEDMPYTQMLADINAMEYQLFDPTNTINIVIMGIDDKIYQSKSGLPSPVTAGQVKQFGVFGRLQNSDGSNIWVASDSDNLTDRGPGPYLYVCRTLRAYIDQKFRKIGYLIIQLQFSSLESVFSQSKLEQGEYYAVADKEGVALYHSADRKLTGKAIDNGVLAVMQRSMNGYGTITSGNEQFLITYSKSQGGGWDVIHALPLRVIAAQASAARNFILLILLLSLALSFPLLLLVARAISKPVGRLKDTVEEFGRGNLATRAEVRRMDEIGHLQVSFNKMAEDINGLIRKNEEEHRQRRMIELNIMEYQINPHFLYNSLDSINWMAQKAGNEEIEEMVTALARFFRIGLSKGREFYSIRDELEHARQYLLINKIRYKDCFQYRIEADPDALDCLTMKVLLQPIIENAIKYGVDKNKNDGEIIVSVALSGGSVLFEVRDNGAGLPPERLQTIQSVLAKRNPIEEGAADGFGLFNVNQRIWMQYGEGFGITMMNADGGGAIVQIRIPLICRQVITAAPPQQMPWRS